MPNSRAFVVPAIVATSVLALAGCVGGSGSPLSGAPDDAFTIVTSTNVYGQIADEIARDAVEVTAIITSAAQDPHAYEPSAADQLTVQDADLIVLNGGGYDAFMDALIEASGSQAPIIVATEHVHDGPGAASIRDDAHEDDAHAHEARGDHGHIDGVNEHVWYDPRTVELVAEDLAAQLSAHLPEDAAVFEANLEAFVAGIADLEAGLADIHAAHRGEQVLVTEPVPGHLVAAAGLVDVTPSEFSEAVEEGRDVPPATLLDALDLVGSGSLGVVIANAQTGGAETTQVIEAATAAGVPVVEFSETLPEGQTYLSWMQQNIDELAGALGQ